MSRRVLALGLDPAFADLSALPELTPDLVRAFVQVQLERLRALGYDVRGCLVDAGESAEMIVARLLAADRFDVIVIDAGLRAPEHLLLFERLLNLLHVRAPHARLCFDSSPADMAEAVQRWLA